MLPTSGVVRGILCVWAKGEVKDERLYMHVSPTTECSLGISVSI